MKMQFSGFLISGLSIQCNMPENSKIVQLQDCYIEWKENYFIYWHLIPFACAFLVTSHKCAIFTLLVFFL